MIRRIALAVVLGLVALAIWLPREQQVAADAPIADAPHGVSFRAERATSAAPFVERWELSYPETPPASQTMTLAISEVSGTTASGRPAVVMDFFEGGTLHDRLKAYGPLPAEEVLRPAVMYGSRNFATSS